ncbi:MAG: hypothetical protein P8J17_01415 [Halioglobus sp.]|nr:hypothetical protein [Halioglobus sp.]
MNACAVWLIYTQGYQILTLILVPVMALLLWRLHHDPLQGAWLIWTKGVWTLECKGLQKAIDVGKRSIALPWIIYVSYRDIAMGRDGHIWLYADSLSPQARRRLRVRLTLQQ